MKIHQFIDSGLAHFSYGIVSNGEMAVIDPGRDPRPYYEFAQKEGARIVAIFETHPHADFVSSHAEISHATNAPIYVSRLVYPSYKHKGFDDGDQVQVGNVVLRAINTPGHSPDSICITAEIDGFIEAVFTGDTLMIGDVGRPDLREDGRDRQTDRRVLARAMYYSIHDRLLRLPASVKVYPAHGGGSLCSRSQESATFSTIGQEMISNPSLRKMEEQEFIEYLLQDQPFVPKYFLKDVAANRRGAADFEKSLQSVPIMDCSSSIPVNALIIDTRNKPAFDSGHLKGSINLMDGGKFETWLGSIIGPNEHFYLVASDTSAARSVLEKAAKIGYEAQVKGVWICDISDELSAPQLSVENFEASPDKYTIVDVRNTSEAQAVKVFENSINIPLPELRERWSEIPRDKPIVVHCAAGYRSAAGASILRMFIKSVPVFDLSENITSFVSKRKAA